MSNVIQTPLGPLEVSGGDIASARRREYLERLGVDHRIPSRIACSFTEEGSAAEIVCPTTDRLAWLRARQTGITASDVSGILELEDSFKTPAQIIAGKLGPIGDGESDDAAFHLKRGQILERPIIELAQACGAAPAGQIVQMPLLRSRAYPLLLASCDPGILLPDGTWVQTEVKSVAWHKRDEWGERGSDQIPDRVRCQVAIQRIVTGVDRILVLAYIDGQNFEPRPYWYQTDEAFEANLIVGLKAWWQRYIIERQPPELDGEPETTRALRYLIGGEGREKDWAEPELAELLDQLVADQNRRKNAEHLEELTKQKAMLAIGDREGIAWPGGSVSFKTSKDSVSTDWQAIAEHLFNTKAVTSQEAAELIASNQTTRPGSRSFRVYPKKAKAA